jgi:hypothetical protein
MIPTPLETSKHQIKGTEWPVLCWCAVKQLLTHSCNVTYNVPWCMWYASACTSYVVLCCSTFKMGCPFAIWLNANKDGTKLIVTKTVPNHNHEVRKVSNTACFYAICITLRGKILFCCIFFEVWVYCKNLSMLNDRPQGSVSQIFRAAGYVLNWYYLALVLQEIVENLPKRRKLDSSEETTVQHMLELHANKWLIQQHILKETGRKQCCSKYHEGQVQVRVLEVQVRVQVQFWVFSSKF